MGQTTHDKHRIVRRALREVGKLHNQGSDFFLEEHRLSNTFMPDFYIPSVNLCVEVNGVRAYYPYTRKENQIQILKSKLVKGSQLQEM